jgi:hypothetical protein
MKAPTRTPEQMAADRKAEYVAARNTYILIIGSFLTVCIIAVVATTRMEANKTGFRPIKTQAPMLFFDKTYMYDEKDPPPATEE